MNNFTSFDKSLEKHNVPKVTEQEIENMNTHISIKDPELVILVICNRSFSYLKTKTTPSTFICEGPIQAISLFDDW